MFQRCSIICAMVLGSVAPTLALADCPTSNADLENGIWATVSLLDMREHVELSGVSRGARTTGLVETQYTESGTRKGETRYNKSIYPVYMEPGGNAQFNLMFTEHLMAPEATPGLNIRMGAMVTEGHGTGGIPARGYVSFAFGNETYDVELGDCTFQAFAMERVLSVPDFGINSAREYHFLPELQIAVMSRIKNQNTGEYLDVKTDYFSTDRPY